MKHRKRYIRRRRQTARPSDGRRLRLVVFAVTFLLLLLIWSQRKSLIQMPKYGYLGIFVVNFISSSSILLPLPGVASVFLGGALWNPILVGLASGIGATLGELFGFLLGYGGRGLLRTIEHENHWVKRVERFFHKTGFVTIFLFSLLPLPVFDFIGIMSGALNYPLLKFGMATFMGRVIRNILLAWTGAKILPM